jgi:ankyrin repeat protein
MGAKKDFNKVNRHGLTRFLRAVEQGEYATVAKMLNNGADINSRSGQQNALSRLTTEVPYATGSTALHIACAHGHGALVTLLLRQNADANALDDAQCTPMDCAVHSLSYYENICEKRKQSALPFRRAAEKAHGRVDDYEKIILALQAAGGKSAFYALPKKFLPPAPDTP